MCVLLFSVGAGVALCLQVVVAEMSNSEPFLPSPQLGFLEGINSSNHQEFFLQAGSSVSGLAS